MARALQISNLETAITTHFAYPEIGNKEIGELWGTKSPSTINRLKHEAYALMREKGVKAHGQNQVVTKIAYEAWGLNISEMISNYKKLKTLGLLPSQKEVTSA